MNYVLLGYYAASSGNSLPTFLDNQLVPSSGFQNPRRKLGPTGYPETSVRSYNHLCNSPEERSCHAATCSFAGKKETLEKNTSLMDVPPIVIRKRDKYLVWLRAPS